MTGCCLGGHGDDRYLQAPADGFCDLSNRHTLFVDRVIPRPGSSLLKRQPIEGRGIEPVHRRPAIEPVANISRDALLANKSDHTGDDALLVPVMHLRQAHYRHAHAVRSHWECRLLRHPWRRVEAPPGTWLGH